MSKDKKFDCKHLTTTQRIKIEKGLMDGESFASIARNIDKHPSTVTFRKERILKKFCSVLTLKAVRCASFVKIKIASNLVSFVTIRSFVLGSVPLFVQTIRNPSVLRF